MVQDLGYWSVPAKHFQLDWDRFESTEGQEYYDVSMMGNFLSDSLLYYYLCGRLEDDLRHLALLIQYLSELMMALPSLRFHTES